MRIIILSLAVIGALGVVMPVAPAKAEGISVNIGGHGHGRHHGSDRRVFRHDHDRHHHRG